MCSQVKAGTYEANLARGVSQIDKSFMENVIYCRHVMNDSYKMNNITIKLGCIIKADMWTFFKLKTPGKTDFRIRTRELLMTGETPQPLSYRDSDGQLRCKFDIRVARTAATMC